MKEASEILRFARANSPAWAFAALAALFVSLFGLTSAPAEAPAKKKAKPRGTLIVQVNGLPRGASPKVVISGPKVKGKVVRKAIGKRGRTTVKRLPLGRYKVTTQTVKIAGGKAEPSERSVSLRLSKKKPKGKVVVEYMVLPGRALIAPTISAGTFHTCAVRASGQAVCWGSNSEGQLGNGTSGQGTSSNVPVSVQGLGDATQISAGLRHTCAIRQSGQAVCWGWNLRGQLGDGTDINTDVPENVRGLGDAIAISAGNRHTCAIRQSGQAVCWGLNTEGQLGDGTLANVSKVPVNVQGLSDAKEISAGDEHTCAIRQSGQAVCWGRNLEGQLGNGANTNSNVPVDVSGLNDAKAISAGGAHTCAVRQTEQAVCWGSNKLGQLGDGAFADSNVPVNVLGLTNATQISAGDRYTCAIRQTEQAVCWGWNRSGQLGNGTTTSSTSPVNVRGLGDASVISAGYEHTCAIRQTEQAVCWGRNDTGQIGNGANTDTDVPVNVRPG